MLDMVHDIIHSEITSKQLSADYLLKNTAELEDQMCDSTTTFTGHEMGIKYLQSEHLLKKRRMVKTEDGTTIFIFAASQK